MSKGKAPRKIIAVDPGPEQSAFIVWNGHAIWAARILSNEEFLNHLINFPHKEFPLVIEQIKSMGMPVSDTIFDTVFWTGRFCQAWKGPFFRVPRMDVKMHICNDSRAKDSNIRQALINRFGPPGTKKEMGLTYGLKKDLWQAFGLAVTFWDFYWKP